MEKLRSFIMGASMMQKERLVMPTAQTIKDKDITNFVYWNLK